MDSARCPRIEVKKRIEHVMKRQIPHTIWFVALLTLLSTPHLASAYYDPGVQRWINRDPEWFAELNDEGPHLYACFGNNPVSAVDPEGLCPCPAFESQWPTALVKAGGLIPFPIIPSKTVCIHANTTCLNGCEAEYGAAAWNDYTESQNQACRKDCRNDCRYEFAKCMAKVKKGK